MSGFAGVAFIVLSFILFIVTLAGYYEGMEQWLGWGFFASFAVMAVCFLFRDLGGLFISGVGFYGMWQGFGWHWWQAGLVAFPMIAIMVGTMLGGGVLSILGSAMKSVRGSAD